MFADTMLPPVVSPPAETAPAESSSAEVQANNELEAEAGDFIRRRVLEVDSQFFDG